MILLAAADSYVERCELDAMRRVNVEAPRVIAAESKAVGAMLVLFSRTSGVFGADPWRKYFVYQLVDRLRSVRPSDVLSDQLITTTHATLLAPTVVPLLEPRGFIEPNYLSHRART